MGTTAKLSIWPVRIRLVVPDSETEKESVILEPGVDDRAYHIQVINTSECHVWRDTDKEESEVVSVK